MAKVRLIDVIDTVVYRDLQAEHRTELTAFFDSGVVQNNPLAVALANAPGHRGVLPYWLDLDASGEPNFSTDTDNVATPDKVSQAIQETVKTQMNNGWATKDLALELQRGTDAMQHIKNRTAAFWDQIRQRRIIASTVGLYNANAAGNYTNAATGSPAGDMIHDIVGNAGAAGEFSRSAFVDTVATMGDRASSLAAVLVHSAIYFTMVKNDDIDYIVDSNGTFSIPTYMGKRVIVDDSSPAFVVGGNVEYISTVYGAAAFAYGEGTPEVPVEMDRDVQTGDGGGEDQLWERMTELIHPVGHTKTAAQLSVGNNLSENEADLRFAGNYQRTHRRKNVPIAFLRSRAAA